MISAETACWDIERKNPNFKRELLLAALPSSVVYTFENQDIIRKKEKGFTNQFFCKTCQMKRENTS
jgi:hypothetical protein